MSILQNISRRAYYVWRRNLDVSLVTWKTNLLPPITEPILYIFAFGFGLGNYVRKINYGGAELDFITFLAPGMIAVGIMFHSFFECMYGSFVRMYYQKTFDAIINTPLTPEDVFVGEILWGGTRGLFAGTIILAVISMFGLASYPSSLIIIPLAFMAGILFASFGFMFAAVASGIDTLNLPTFLLITPMFLFSGTFFPVDGMPFWAQKVAWLLPLTHVVNITRAATLSNLSCAIFWNLAYILVISVVVAYLAIVLMKKRLIK